MRRAGFTLIEALVVCLVAATVLGSLIAFLVNSQAWSVRATDQGLALAELRVGLARITREVREARQVAYPGAGRKPQSGLGLITPRGETVFYRLVPAKDAPASTPSDLVRETISGTAGTRSGDPAVATRELVVPRVTRFTVAVDDPGPGREPSLVRLLITRATGLEAGSDTGVSLLTSAAARAVQSRCVALRGEEP